MLDEAQLNRIQDPEAKKVVQQLANLLEQALTDIDLLRAENQRLKDEINRSKGEQGKPNIKPNKPLPKNPDDHSSEQARKTPQTWKKGTKNDKIVIDRIQPLTLDRDALPPGYEGGFGPDLKAFVLGLHHLGNVSQGALHTFLTHAGIQISTGSLCNFLIEGQESFHQEKREIGVAGLASSPWQQTDDTATRVDGVNQHAHVLCNPLYTTYTTLPRKDRLSVLSVLQTCVSDGGSSPRFMGRNKNFR